MRSRSLTSSACLFAALVVAAPASAQQVTGFKWSKQMKIEQPAKGHVRLSGEVEAELDDGTKLYAEQVESFSEEHRGVASGNVVFVQATSRIAADRAEFDTRTAYGTFYHASGSASVADRASRDMFGSQEPDVYFYGETIERIGPKKYRVTKGGFTTCLQPTPRWQLTSGSVVLNVDDYAFARNTFLRVKSVPVLYLPFVYYPINKEDRATGFLMPAYGASTIRGFTLSNAFFWAIGRSQDATLMHDWFTASGQGFGGEYRYVLGPGADGNFRTYWLREKARTVDYGSGPVSLPERRSYQIRGSGQQPLVGGLRLRGNLDYFSDVTVQQTYNQNIYDASRRSRGYGLNVSGAWGAHSVNGLVSRNETFLGETDTWLTGNEPRVGFNRALQRISGTPLFWAVTAEYARLLYQSRALDRVNDQGLSRFDLIPQLRAPFRRWQFLTIDPSISWRGTYYTESLAGGVQVEEPVLRRYVQMEARVTGPVFTRVWNTPDNGYAERFKHVIEPSYTISRVTAFDTYDRIVKIDGADYALGGTTKMAYGLTNRFLAKRRLGPGGSMAREFLSVSIRQTYYSDARASQYDYSYSTSFRGRDPSSFSPILIDVQGRPADGLSAGLRLEYDYQLRAFQSLTAAGSVALGEYLQAGGSYSRRRLRVAYQLDDYLGANVALRTRGNRVGGSYSFNYDFARSAFLQNRIIGYYNAQCCGFAVEYQAFNYPQFSSRFPVNKDRRFNFSVTLAGLGTFSNLFGALGGGQF